MSYRKAPRAVENYETPFWVTLGIIFFMGSWIIAAVYGFTTVLLCALGIELFARFLAKCAEGDKP